MYTQALNAGDGEPAKPEDPVRIAAFLARIEAEERIEPNDWMPEQYRRTLVRQIPACPFRGDWNAAGGQLATRAPTLKRKAQLLAKI